MAKSITNKKIAQNTLISVGAQAMSLSISLLINLCVPKFIDEYQYAYWQTYLLYVGYVGLLHLGLLDGIVLRYAKYDYEELDKKKMNFFFYTLVFFLMIFSLCGVGLGIIFGEGIGTLQVCLLSISIITKNLLTFSSYSFQITNRIKQYARAIILQRFFYGIFIVGLLALGVNSFYYFCIADILTDVVGFIYSIHYNKEIYRPQKNSFEDKMRELRDTLHAGITLLIANFSSNFIVGSSKIAIQTFWPPLVFGKVAFGFSITNIFLNFVTAISVVLFPSLKRIDEQELPKVYTTIRSIMMPLLLLLMLCYFPGGVLLKTWLPKYKDSLTFAGILLPSIIYTTNVNLLINNYLKVYRKEKEMFKLNVGCILIELCGLCVISYFIKNVTLVLLWTVLIILLRSLRAEQIVSGLIGFSFLKEQKREIALSILFVVCVISMNWWQGFLLYAAGVLVYFNSCIKNKWRGSLIKLLGK